ncbi:MAG TPA: antitoxin [Bdellovibrionota bacterium]|nr:antitoxin [Bdellovibrionota bacterium]
MGKKAIQYTIRGIGSQLDNALKALAKKSGKSLNQLITELLMRQAQLSIAPQTFSDLDFLFGAWVKDPEVEKAIAEQRTIDEELWK